MRAQILGVQFGILSPEVIRRESVVNVQTVTLYQKNIPAENGMNDLRMGTCDRRINCSTCRHDVITCPGHPGHIELAAPVYHIGFLPTVLKMLRVVCFFCSALLVPIGNDDPRLSAMYGRDRLDYIGSLCRHGRACRSCGGVQPKFERSKQFVDITTEFETSVEDPDEAEFIKLPFSAGRALSILRDISDDVIAVLGGCPVNARPEWMILTVIQVPAPISRPCVTMSDGARTRGQDDVTIKLIDVLKANKNADVALRDGGCVSGFTNPEAVVGEFWNYSHAPNVDVIRESVRELQQHVAHLMHGSAGVEVNSGRPNRRQLRLFHERWKGKKGRFRGNLVGKRVNYSSRTVASPGAGFDVDEIGVPRAVANHLTFPERVTQWNRDALKRCVRLGPGVDGGAAAISVPGGDIIDLTFCSLSTRTNMILQIGWIVERHLRDGDWVLVNRQPSLHRMSLMAHRVRVVADNTFRLPVCDTTPYNADFDGDELNLHVLQTHEARAEAQELMRVSTQMINPQNNKPIIALVQDALISGFLLTGKDTFLEKHQCMQIMMELKYTDIDRLPMPAILKPRPLWTGKQMFSVLFPATFCLTTLVTRTLGGTGSVALMQDTHERHVRILRGELVCGALCKKTLGTSARGIVHVLFNDWGCDAASAFVSDAQRLLQAFVMIRGFSVGLGDCILSAHGHRKQEALLRTAFTRVTQVHAQVGHLDPGVVEECTGKMLNNVLTQSGVSVLEEVEKNRIAALVESGAKGSAINLAQILGCVGQQSVEGGKIADSVHGFTLPAFSVNDTSPLAHGFVSNSYATGLTSHEYFFHAMGGREGLVDTAVKTADIGYVQRKLSKAQEGLLVSQDGTVRNVNGDVVQMYYGGDGLLHTALECSFLPTFNLTDAAIRQRCYVPGWEQAVEDEVQQMMLDRDYVRRIQCVDLVTPNGFLVVAVEPQRVLLQAKLRFGTGGGWDGPAPLLKLRNTLLRRIRGKRPPYVTRLTRIYIFAHLTLREMQLLTREGAQWACDTLHRQYERAVVQPGEMVGTVSASSIGEPCTQMTLNTFHTAGVAHAVSQGVPRLKELILLTEQIATPSMTVHLEPGFKEHREIASRVLSAIAYTSFADVVAHGAVVKGNEGDTELLDVFQTLYHPEPTPYALRFVLHRQRLYEKHLDVSAIVDVLRTQFGNAAYVMGTDVNSVEWVVRIHPLNLNCEDNAYAMRLLYDHVMENLVIQGVYGISRVTMEHQARTHHNVHYAPMNEFFGRTAGSSLATVMNIPGVDAARTLTNDIFDILDVLGIEAASKQLLTEIRAVLSHDGAYVNDRHLQLLVDVMSYAGDLAPVSRHSMEKLGADVYTRASFEQTQEVLLTAATHGVYNKLKGVTSTLITGTPISGGTGLSRVRSTVSTAKHTVQPMVFEETVAKRVAPMELLPPKRVRIAELPPFWIPTPERKSC